MLQNSSNNNKEISALTLSKLSARIKEQLSAGFPDTFWVVAEISEMHVNHSGHAYLDLVEKDPDNDRILARIRATIWSYTFRILRPYFEGTTGYQLSKGIKVMVNVSLEYHAQYSISLNIKDIDPNYTLGDLARKKAEIIEKLTSEGVIDMNRQLDFPLVPQNIAVISSPTAAGFEDFLNTLSNNIYDFRFNITLFQAVMQGEKAEQSIITALEQVYDNEDMFDVVVIIRGGGASIELDCFNNYDLAFHISQFPLPVLTGIGHERDETVADLVAWMKLKTPTAVAEMLIDSVAQFLGRIEDAESYIMDRVKERLSREKERISMLSGNLTIHTRKSLYTAGTYLNAKSYELKAALQSSLSASLNNLSDKLNRVKFHIPVLLTKGFQYLDLSREKVSRSVNYRFKEEKEKITSLEKISALSDPEYILSRGYSITSHNGKVLKDTDKVKKGDEIITQLHKGKLKSKIK